MSNIIKGLNEAYGRYGRNRDAYQRDYDASVTGMGKRDSYAYQQDGGANDEGWDEPQQSYQPKPVAKKGYYFYTVPADQEDKANEVGLFRTKSGKWYSPFQNTRADMFFGRGKYWEPKNESTQLDELSPKTLADYKKAAGADASKSDRLAQASREVKDAEMAQKLTNRANKRFSGIVKATKKEFDNDAKGVAEGFEPGHREIERWATKSEENQKIYNAYIKAGKMADEAYTQKDGATYTGLQLRKKQIRDLIAKKMSEQGVAEEQLDEACWDTHKQVGMKSKGGKMVPNCVPKESIEEAQQCPECGGPMFSDLLLAEKKDACYHKVRSRYKVWPSAYASGALVQCRKKGASNWGNKSKNEDVAEGLDEEQVDENLRKWFKEKWVRFGPDGKIRGACARGDDSEGKPKCLPQAKAHALGKKGRASAAARKRREDPNPERSGKAINVNTKKKSNEGVAEGSEERSQNRLWQMITDYEQRAKATKNDIKKAHYLKMASELRGKLKTSDEQGVAEQELDEACWKGYHKEGNKKMFGKTYPNCVKNTNEEQELEEKWSQKYKDSINCSNPKGFSQKAHCAGKKKNESAIMKGLKL